MSRSPRRIAPMLAAAAVVAATVVSSAGPVHAVIVPEWPAGYVPLGCTVTGFAGGGSGIFQVSYSDPLQPTVVDTAVNGTTSVVLRPGAVATQYQVNVTASETCSGVGSLSIAWVRQSTGTYQAMTMSPLTTDVFQGRHGGINSAQADEAGVYRVGVAVVARRYDSFVLDGNFRLASPPVPTGGSTFFTTGSWSLKPLYLLRQTTLTIVAPSSVKKGRLAAVSGVLRYATNAGFVADAGERVLVQTRVGSAAWKNVAVVAATASGAVTAKVKLLRTSQVRFVHTSVLSGRFTAAVTSVTKTIKVI